MRKYSVVAADPARSNEMRRMQRWIEKFVCVVRPPQQVVGHRIDRTSSVAVTQAQANAGDRAAHVCPFVQTSIDRDDYWLEESQLTNQDGPQIEALLLAQAQQFPPTAPAYDPMGTGQPDPAPDGVIFKTFMTIFPNVLHTTGAFPFFDSIHQKLKPTFMHKGLMLGQFYHGCPDGEGGIYAPAWVGIVLSSPVPAFAIRYMVKEDHVFNLAPGAAAWIVAAHKRYFP